METETLPSPKRQKILDGAMAAFHELGFEGASVDEIARRAGVSKATLYSHFTDKKGLFIAGIHEQCQAQAQRIIDATQAGESLEATLRRIAREYLGFLFSPTALNLFRLIVAESQRFPEIGHAFWQSGPDVAIRRLAQFFAAQGALGELKIDDPERAAFQFIELCRSELFFKRLLGILRKTSAADVDRSANAAVSTFLRAYRP